MIKKGIMMDEKINEIKSRYSGKVEEFRRERERLNDIIMKYADTSTKRFFALDTQVYQEGSLDRKTKELIGLASSIVLRCDDCILYHLIRCHEEGVSPSELVEAADIALVVGGSITIPHIRRMFGHYEEILKKGEYDGKQ